MKYARLNESLANKENFIYYVNIKNYLIIEGHGKSLESIIRSTRYLSFDDTSRFLYILICDMYVDNHNILFKNIMKYILNFCYYNPNTSADLFIKTIVKLMQEDDYNYNNSDNTHIMKFNKDFILDVSRLSNLFYINITTYVSFNCCQIGFDSFLTEIHNELIEYYNYKRFHLKLLPKSDEFKLDLIINLIRKCPIPYNEDALVL